MKEQTAFFLLLTLLASSCGSNPDAAEQAAESPIAAHSWKNVSAIDVPLPPGATPVKRWQFQAVMDDAFLYLRFTYPEALPAIGKNLADTFEPTDKSLNQLPFVKLFVPAESLTEYENRRKARLPDGTQIDFSQKGDPKPDFEIHVQFFLRSKGADGRQRCVSGGRFDESDLVQDYRSAVIGMQGYVKSLKEEETQRESRYYFERWEEPSQFVIENSSFIFTVPLAHGKTRNGKTIEPFLNRPLPDMSLRVFPGGSNHYKPYIPKRINDTI